MMVVDLAIDREHQRAIGGPDRLRPACRVNDGKALMDQQRAAAGMHAAPVGTTMSLACRQRQRERPQRGQVGAGSEVERSEEHTSELQSLMRNSYAVFCLKKKIANKNNTSKKTHTHSTINARTV